MKANWTGFLRSCFQWFGGCKICACDGIDGSLLNHCTTLRYAHPAKRGYFYQCQKCSTTWYLDEMKRWLYRIHDSHWDLVQHWDKGHFPIEGSIQKDLASIGGVINYFKDEILIPCAVVEKSGTQVLKAIVIISKRPLNSWPRPDAVRWADALLCVSPSPFALNRDVRLASFSKQEEAMGFAPIAVMDRNGNEYTLGNESHFFDYLGVKGSELSLCGHRKRRNKVVWPQEAQTYYYVDWFEQCEDLVLK